MRLIPAQTGIVENLKKETSDLLKNLKKMEDKHIALRAAIQRRDARLEASQDAVRTVEPATAGKFVPHKTRKAG
jgi:hypothetical protein